MKERQGQEGRPLSPEREKLFSTLEAETPSSAQIYRLGDKFKELSPELAAITMLDVTNIQGCHYGLKNVFVPIIHYLEVTKNSDEKSMMTVSPENAILVESSTGNGWVAFSDAATKLGYEHIVVMPGGLPEPRYHHPQGRKVEIIRTPKEEYAEGMRKQLKDLIDQNKQRLLEGKKIYVSPNHSIRGADITIKTMSELGRQLVAGLGELHDPLRVVVSMGNGSSLCAIGEYVKNNTPKAKVVATEDFAYGGGYDRFAQAKGLPTYGQLFGIKPGTKELIEEFTTYGTNVPFGIKLPLQARAMDSGLIDEYVLFADNEVLEAYAELHPKEDQGENALKLPNRSKLPRILFEAYGNSTLANIAVASRFTNSGERVVAIAYDSRKNY